MQEYLESTMHMQCPSRLYQSSEAIRCPLGLWHSMHGWAAWLKLLGFHWQQCHHPGLRSLDVGSRKNRRWLKLQSFLCGSWNIIKPYAGWLHQGKFVHQEPRRASLRLDMTRSRAAKSSQIKVIFRSTGWKQLFWHCFDLASWESGLQTHGVLD